MNKNNKKRAKDATKRLVFSALMVAMSLIIGIVCKAYFTFTPVLRLTFENMPIILLGFMFGPIYSVMAAVGADIISALGAGYSPTPLITVGAACLGLLAGVLPKAFKKSSFASLLSVELVSHFVGSLLVKTYALCDLYTLDFLPTFWVRLPLYIAISCAEAYLIYIITKNRQICSLMNGKAKNDEL